MKKIIFKNVFRLLFLFLFFGNSADAQHLKDVVPSLVNKAYSPTITEAKILLDKTRPSFNPRKRASLISAYTYTNSTNTQRKVAVSLSPDGGDTWTTHKLKTALGYVGDEEDDEVTLTYPNYGGSDNSSDALENMDDPQLITLQPLYSLASQVGTSPILLVVRAWDGAPNRYAGEYLTDQPGSIFLKSGIYVCVSLDNGNTWGYYDAVSGDWEEGTWGVVAEKDNVNTVEFPETIEHPRVAYRPDFGPRTGDFYNTGEIDENFGYIVFGKVKYHRLIPAVNDFRLSSSQIGIRTFNHEGRLVTTHSGGPYISSTGFSDKSPLRPSVAISPDKAIWMSFYTVDVGPNETSTLPTKNNGGEILPMKIYFSKGTSNLTFSVNTIGFESPQELVAPEERFAMGRWDIRYGAIRYAAPGEDGFKMDLASGPSIQIVSEKPHKCDPEYKVGILYVHGVPKMEEGLPIRTDFTYRSRLSFYSGHLLNGGSASNLNSGNFTADKYGWITKDYTIESDSKADADAAGNKDYLRDKSIEEFGHYWNMRFFPVLKYTNVYDPNYFSITFDGQKEEVNKFYYSPTYFLAGYMSTYQKDWGVPPNRTHLTHSQCKVGVSFDNLTFRVNRYKETTPSTFTMQDENYVVGAQPFQKIYGDINTTDEFWGSKMDVAGYAHYRATNEPNWDVHPIWHNIAYSSGVCSTCYDQKLKTNTGNAILAQAYVANTASYLPEAFPKANSTTGGYFKTNLDAADGYSWGDYAYFDFNESNRPSVITANPTLTSATYGSLQNNHAVSGSGKDFYLNINNYTESSVSTVPYSLFYGLYKDHSIPGNVNPTGDFGTSNQRKLVMTGDLPHLIYERGGDVWYTNNRGIQAPESPDMTIFAAGMKLSTSGIVAGETTTRKRPSIAVYQLGNPITGTAGQHEFSGKTAIAVTWVEYTKKTGQPTTVKVFMRTREFDVCTYSWNAWSSPYMIHSHQYAADPVNKYAADEDYTTPVIAPLIKQSTGQLTNLLGWTITWTSPQLNVAAFALPGKRHTAIYSKTWLRYNAPNVITDNSQWGKYYTNPSGYCKPNLPNTHNVIFEAPVPLDNVVRPLDFPTVVNSENKFQPSTLKNELAYSTDGSINGIWHRSITYSTSGATVGDMTSASTAKDLSLVFNTGNNYYADRNPCITINSTGQIFVAWEQMYRQFPTYYLDEFGYHMTSPGRSFSRIVTTNSFFPTNDWAKNGLTKVKTIFEEDAKYDEPLYFRWLLNPSITGYPKSRLLESNNPIDDKDPGVVELLFWKNNQYLSGSESVINKLQNRLIFSEGHGKQQIPNCNGKLIPEQKGDGIWLPTTSKTYNNPVESDGINSQRSFSMFNAGPTFEYVPAYTCPDDKDLSFAGTAYALGNFALGATTDLTKTAVPTIGVYKGTYLTHTGMEHYRGEEFRKDSEAISFAWGGVYAGDTSLAQPLRQVKLSFIHDTNYFANFKEFHDSLFQTETFDWQPGKEIQYWRGMFVTDTNAQKVGGAFFTPSVSLRYTVELVSDSGRTIDTLEVIDYSPFFNKNFSGDRRTYINGNLNVRDVRLRVRGSVSGLNTSDTTAELRSIFRSTAYQWTQDSTIIVYKGAPEGYHPTTVGKLTVYGLYPNPSLRNTTVNVGFNFLEGYPVTVAIYDVLGKEVGEPVVVESNGKRQVVSIPTNLPTGAYFMRLSVSGEHVTIPMTVQDH